MSKKEFLKLKGENGIDKGKNSKREWKENDGETVAGFGCWRPQCWLGGRLNIRADQGPGSSSWSSYIVSSIGFITWHDVRVSCLVDWFFLIFSLFSSDFLKIINVQISEMHLLLKVKSVWGRKSTKDSVVWHFDAASRGKGDKLNLSLLWPNESLRRNCIKICSLMNTEEQQCSVTLQKVWLWVIIFHCHAFNTNDSHTDRHDMAH